MTDDEILAKYIREKVPKIEVSKGYLVYYIREKLKEAMEEDRCRKGGKIRKKR